MIQVSRAVFEVMAEAAWLEVPEVFRARVGNLVILIEDVATRDDVDPDDSEDDPAELFGLYVGEGMAEHGEGMELPATIRLFQRAHESACDTLEELQAEITRTMLHEVAHHFGIDDDRLEELGAY